MTENIEQPVVPAQPEPELPPALQGIPEDKMKLIREKIKKFTESGKKTISGSEAPSDAPAAAGEPDVGQTASGKDVDWSEYALDFSVKHLYPQATFRMTPQGPKWVAMVDEFHSTTRTWRNQGKKVNVPGSVDKQFVEPLNLGEYLNDMLNSPEGWRLVSVLPTSLGDAGVLLQRTVPVILPDPQPLKKETEVEAPRDPELQKVEDAALSFMSQEGLTPPPVPCEDEVAGMDSLEAQALALNPPARLPGTAPEPDKLDEVREVVKAALDGPDVGVDPATIIGKESNAGIHAEADEFGASPQ